MITIVLLGTEYGLSIGMIARAMKNFGLTELVLIDPKVKKTNKDAIKYAKHAQDVLKKAKIKKKNYLKSFDYVIGTTAQLGSDYNIPRSTLTPEQLFSKKEWNVINRSLVVHGQNICAPISPFCSKCPIEKYCPKIDVKSSR